MFVLTTGQDVHANTLSAYEAGQRVWNWTVQSAAVKGDLFVMYVARPIHAFSWIGRMRSDAERPPGERGDWTAWVEMYPIGQPLGLQEARRLPVVAESSLMKPRGLHRTSRRVDTPVWRALVSAAEERDPRVTAVLASWRSPGAPIEESSWFVWDAARAGIEYPFLKEHQLQERIKQALEDTEGMREPEPEDGLGLPAFEARLGPRNRADIVLVDEGHDKPRLVVVETKLFARDVAGLLQLERYREWLRAKHPDWDLDLVLAAQVIGPEVRARAQAAGMSCVEVRPFEDDDELLPGDGELTLEWSGPAHEIVFDEVEVARRTRLALETLGSPGTRTSITAARRLTGIPDDPGVVALWINPADADGLDDLGRPQLEAEQPLLVLGCLHLASTLEELAGPDLLPTPLVHHLSLVMGVTPRPIDSGSHRDEDARRRLASWMETHLQISFTPTPGVMPSVVARAGRRTLKPFFSGYAGWTIDTVVGAFAGDVAFDFERALWSRSWENWASYALAGTLEDPPTAGLRVAVDEALEPVAFESDPSADDREDAAIAFLDPTLWTDGVRLLKETAPADRLDAQGRPPRGWAAAVDLFDPLAVLVLLVGEEIRRMGMGRTDDDGRLIVLTGDPSRHLVELPGSDPDAEVELTLVSSDGTRRIVDFSALTVEED